MLYSVSSSSQHGRLPRMKRTKSGEVGRSQGASAEHEPYTRPVNGVASSSTSAVHAARRRGRKKLVQGPDGSPTRNRDIVNVSACVQIKTWYCAGL